MKGGILSFTIHGSYTKIDVRVPCSSTSQRLSAPKPMNTSLTIGYTYGEPFGRMKNIHGIDPVFGNYSTSTELQSIFSFTADVYISRRLALMTTLEYGRMKTIQRFTDFNNLFVLFFLPNKTLTIRSEIVSFGSGVRYHPLEQIEPLFLQMVVGIFWMNPLEETQPKYTYNCFDKISIGYHFKTLQFVVSPEVGVRTLFMKVAKSRLGGYSQLEAGIKLGILI